MVDLDSAIPGSITVEMEILAQVDLGPLIQSVLDTYIGRNGWTVAFLTYVGTFRLLFKPLITALEAVVKQTPTTKDDELLDRFEKSNTYVWIVWFLDLFASIRFPNGKTTNPVLIKRNEN